jgi:hypothetical protein
MAHTFLEIMFTTSVESDTTGGTEKKTVERFGDERRTYRFEA